MLIYSVIVLSINMAVGLKMTVLENDPQWITVGVIAIGIDLLTLMGIAICFALEYSD